ncbi:MAG: DUF423 domain-containing protein [Chitinophagaceae bacterium]|nr:DUF423 domain-containing protein [Chitinophagaceae bacterium]
MNRNFILAASLFGIVAVGFGAFGAHGLKSVASEEVVSIFETGVRYQFYHVFALLATGILYSNGKEKFMKWSGIMFITGIFLFSGSLFVLTYVKMNNWTGFGWLGPLTPIGGTCLALGWSCLFTGIARGDLKR